MGGIPPEFAYALRGAVLLVGLGYAAVQDVKLREVSDEVWQAMGLAGAALGIVLAIALGPVATLFWVVAAVFVLQHLFAWDLRFERYSPRLPGRLEATFYAATVALLIALALLLGVGPQGLPIEVIAVVASVLVARALFEAGVLYGGADAKALMVIGLILPVSAFPLWSPAAAAGVLPYYPFAINVLIDAAFLALAIPISLAVRNLAAGEFEFPRGFLGYRLPVEELPHRFVWLRDPTFGPSAPEEADTSEADQRLRERQAADLERRGVRRIWVTPQLPFILWILAGTVAALLIGNLVFDLASVL